MPTFGAVGGTTPYRALHLLPSVNTESDDPYGLVQNQNSLRRHGQQGDASNRLAQTMNGLPILFPMGDEIRGNVLDNSNVHSMYPGLGRGGPVRLVRDVTAGGVADILTFLMPPMTGSRLFDAIAGALMGMIWFPRAFLMELLVGLEAGTAAQPALLKTVSAACFGTLAGLLALPVVRRLRASGLIPPLLRAGTAAHEKDVSR